MGTVLHEPAAAPFDRTILARVTARAAAAGLESGRRLSRLPREVAVVLERGGETRIAVGSLTVGPTAEPPSHDVVLGLSMGDTMQQGCIRIDAWLALRVSAAALGAPEPRVLRAPGIAERGALAYELTRILRALGCRARVWAEAFDQARDQAPEDVGTVASIDLWVHLRESDGAVRLCGPASWLDAVAVGPFDAERAARLMVEGAVELGACGLPASQVADAQVGDAVIFDAGVPLRAGLLDAGLRIGAHSARVKRDGDESVVLTSVFEEDKVMSVTRDAGDSAEVLAAAPIEVTAELGRVVLRGDEVIGLRPGSVVALATRPPSVAADLRVAGRLWARGEIVEVDGALGVRITELVR